MNRTTVNTSIWLADDAMIDVGRGTNDGQAVYVHLWAPDTSMPTIYLTRDAAERLHAALGGAL